MKDRINRRKIIYGAAALLAFALLYFGTFRTRAEKTQCREVQVVVLGDSVFADIGELPSVPARLPEALGKTVYNAAFGGTCTAKLETDRRLDYSKGSLSLVGLAKAICAGDFGVQRSAKIRESNAEYFAGIIEELMTIDFDKVEVILVQQGVNDYHAGTPIGNPEDPYDEYTFLGALRTALEALQQANPDFRIVLITPAYAWYTGTGLTCEEADQGGGILEDYVNAELALAEEMGIETIDLYHDYFPHEEWEDMWLYTMDGIHLNEAGREKVVQTIAETLDHEPDYGVGPDRQPE